MDTIISAINEQAPKHIKWRGTIKNEEGQLHKIEMNPFKLEIVIESPYYGNFESIEDQKKKYYEEEKRKKNVRDYPCDN